jgi:hypothetical protein
MNRRNIVSLLAIAASLLATLSGSAFAQQELLKEQLVGTWTLVSYDRVASDVASSLYLALRKAP